MAHLVEGFSAIRHHLLLVSRHAEIYARGVGIVAKSSFGSGITQGHLQGLGHQLRRRFLGIGMRHGIGEDHVDISLEVTAEHLVFSLRLGIHHLSQAIKIVDAALHVALHLVGIEQLHHRLGQQEFYAVITLISGVGTFVDALLEPLHRRSRLALAISLVGLGKGVAEAMEVADVLR